jgi:prepilin-type processing-associated H-X9-DG protein
VGDVPANGVFFNRALGGPQSRLGGSKDGTSLTIMLTENVHKDYDDSNFPMNWLTGTEQQVGTVWVVPKDPGPPLVGNDIIDQEAINKRDETVTTFNPAIPRFARPSSGHSGGALVAFCDGHVEFVREDIEYLTYQRMMTSSGRKCEDPLDHMSDTEANGKTIGWFRGAPPLSEKDFR